MTNCESRLYRLDVASLSVLVLALRVFLWLLPSENLSQIPKFFCVLDTLEEQLSRRCATSKFIFIVQCLLL